MHSILFWSIRNRTISVGTHLSERTSVMRKNNEVTEASQQYATAYAAHYNQGDLQRAFRLYTAIMASHPGSQEDGFSQMQIRNLAAALIPKQQLLDAQVELLRAYFEQTESTDPREIPVATVNLQRSSRSP